jgi:hypothetical protein
MWSKNTSAAVLMGQISVVSWPWFYPANLRNHPYISVKVLINWLSCYWFIVKILLIILYLRPKFVDVYISLVYSKLYSLVGMATGYGLDGPGIESRWGVRFFAPVQTGPGAHLASYTMSIWFLPEVKRLGRGIYHPPQSSAEVKAGTELYTYFPFGSSWHVLWWTLPLRSCTLIILDVVYVALETTKWYGHIPEEHELVSTLQ